MPVKDLQKWEREKYARYAILLDREKDKELIELIEKNRTNRISATMTIRNLANGKIN